MFVVDEMDGVHACDTFPYTLGQAAKLICSRLSPNQPCCWIVKKVMVCHVLASIRVNDSMCKGVNREVVLWLEQDISIAHGVAEPGWDWDWQL